MFVVETQWPQTQIPREDAKLGHGDKSAGTRSSARGGYGPGSGRKITLSRVT